MRGTFTGTPFGAMDWTRQDVQAHAAAWMWAQSRRNGVDWGGLLNIDSEGVIYADAKTGHRTKRPIGKKTRRRCLCHGRITHTGLADDVAMMDGCEWCVRKWVADPDYLPPGFVA